MQKLYRITVTDIAYAYDGSDTYYTTDKEAFDKFNKVERISDVDVPVAFQDEGTTEWMYSDKFVTAEYPHVCMGDCHVWSNC